MASDRTPDHAKARALEYVIAAGVSVVAAVVMLELWKADLRVPFGDKGDLRLCEMLVKAVVDHGDWLTFPRLAAPGRLELADFPVALDWGHFVLLRLLALFTSDWPLVLNLYFLLGFPLITISSLTVFRHLRVSTVPAIVGSVLYAFFPMRVLKAENHLLFDVFFQIPLAVLAMLWLCAEEPPLVGRRTGGGWRLVRDRRTLAAIAICLLVAVTGAYYAFFATFLLVVAGSWAAVEHRSWRHAAAGAAMAGLVVVGSAASLLPVFVYRWRHGVNPDTAARLPQEAEVYGLKLAQLLLPVQSHRLAFFSRITDGYNGAAPVPGDDASGLGIIGSLGFLALLFWVVRRPRHGERYAEVLRALAVLNLAAILFATIGGFGSLFAWLVLPLFRGYARISVFIGFMSIVAFFVLLDRRTRHSPWIARIAPGLLLVGGLFDQVGRLAIRPYRAVKAAFASDAELVQRIEGRAPRGAMIFELPFMMFPEGPDLDRIDSYDLLRPSLHSRSLRWSFPAMRERFEDLWTRAIAAEEPSRMVADLVAADFEGILVDQPGYPDEGNALRETMTRLLDAPPEVSHDGRFAYYSLAALKATTNAALSAEELRRRRDEVLYPVIQRFGGGFYYEEGDPGHSVRWANRDAEIWIENRGPEPRAVTLSLRAGAAHPPARLTLQSDLVSLGVELGPEGTLIERALQVAPGDHRLRIHCDGRPLVGPLSTRTLVWRAEDVTLRQVP
jgi:phosphoglycerol transferase